MKLPAVSVVMPVHNGERYLHAAIDSIVRQSITDWKLVVVDDGSCDRSAAIAGWFASADPRIEVIHLPTRQGLPAALNAGLDAASGPFIARMDADDIAHPHRLAAQMAFLAEHPDIQLAGSAIDTIDGQGRPLRRVTFPATAAQIRFGLTFDNKIAHSSVLLRAGALRSAGLRYSDAEGGSEDYDLWVRFTALYDASNLEQPYMRYRIHPDQFTKTAAERQLRASDRISAKLVADNGPGIAWTREVRQFLDVLYWRAYELVQIAAPLRRRLHLGAVCETLCWRRLPACAAEVLERRILQGMAEDYLNRTASGDPVLVAIAELL